MTKNKTTEVGVDHIEGASMNVAESQMDALRVLCPGVFADGKVDLGKLASALSGHAVDEKEERYGLNWAGKSKCLAEIARTTTATLNPNRAESINFDTTENIFIEGENLEVLKLLQKSYYGKVKMIYIDPPYNTGHDFVYHDAFARSDREEKEAGGQVDGAGYVKHAYKQNSKDSGRYHSNWLNMMYPRLYLARNLLREDGVIFVSIDDNEVHNLRLLMNEIFGEENFVSEIVWHNASRHSKFVSGEHEYIVCFTKQLDAQISWKKPRPEVSILLAFVQKLRDSGSDIEEAVKQLRKEIANWLKKNKKKYSYLQNYVNIDENWKVYYPVDLTGEGDGPSRKFGEQIVPAPAGRHWMGQDTIDELYAENRIVAEFNN